VVAGSPLLTPSWLGQHEPESNSGLFGDNRAIADFWYDAVHRRLLARSLVLHEVDDPADLRLGRAPGRFPNAPDVNATLADGTTVGHVGFVSWTGNGFGAYFAAVQGAVRETGSGFLDLTTATGGSGRTRTGSSYEPDDLIRHVRLHPSGQLEVGFETSPDARPDPLLFVRGNQRVEGTTTTGELHVDGALATGGALTVGAPGGNVPHRCSLRGASGRGAREAVASCGDGELAIGGGGTCSAGELRSSRPVQTGANLDRWAIACSRTGAHAVYAICCAY
jgi:hypothetical protein